MMERFEKRDAEFIAIFPLRKSSSSVSATSPNPFHLFHFHSWTKSIVAVILYDASVARNMNNEHLIYLRFTEVTFNSQEKCWMWRRNWYAWSDGAGAECDYEWHALECNFQVKRFKPNNRTSRISCVRYCRCVAGYIRGRMTDHSKRCSSLDFAQLTRFM